MKNFTPLLFIPVLLGCSRTDLPHKTITLEELTIEVHGLSREIVATNKEAGFLYTETNSNHRSSWQGWNIMAHEVLEDYQILINEKPLERQDVHLTLVAPHQFTRAYHPGVQETVTLLDSIDALIVELDKLRGDRLTVRPLFRDLHLPDDYVVRFEGNTLLIAQTRHLSRGAQSNSPAWLGITIVSGNESSERVTPAQERDPDFSPAGIRSRLTSSRAAVVFVAGDTEADAARHAQSVGQNYTSLIARRKARMETLLNHSYIRTDNRRVDKALQWAMISMDALMMNQIKKGIFAGLPWFNNYWGRDSFISLPGAALVTGHFAEAREILRSFADWQERDRRSPNFGRIPNLVTTTSMQYNTADGTPRFVLALSEYIRYSNDKEFAAEMYPVVKRSIEGALSTRVDGYGFLTHGDAETWMDAVGPDGPWSPRGNRANDIQALWYRQLKAGEELAILAGDDRSATLWAEIARAVRSNFNAHFVDTSRILLIDHLKPDGTPDRQFRPNQLFALSLVPEGSRRERMFRNITEKLVYPHGVASLAQDEENFHPYHHYRPYYVQDAAYHNGIVWTWLAGAWIDAAAQYGLADLAFEVTDNMVNQILDRGAVGTLSELLDAAPRAGEKQPRLSGTVSQAWSLAEFIRAFYHNYLGVTVDAARRSVTLAPVLPRAIRRARFAVSLGSTRIIASYAASDRSLVVTLESPATADTLTVNLHALLKAGGRSVSVPLPPGTKVSVTIDVRRATMESGGARQDIPSTTIPLKKPTHLESVRLATPAVRSDLEALKGPNHRLLTNEEIKASNRNAVILYDAEDPIGDDVGSGSYVYPLTPHLKPGSLDLTRFRVAADATNAYFHLEFRTLSNPGWHPEYGFQLTYVAIAIDKDGKPGSGQRYIGMNSGYVLDPRDAFEAVIYIGGGIRVTDANHRVLAEYLPASGDVANPLGNARRGTISFGLPADLLGLPDPTWRYTVLVGCQDDHGGAGVGDFRIVESVAGEWVGGGRTRPSDPNVYDVLLPAGR